MVATHTEGGEEPVHDCASEGHPIATAVDSSLALCQMGTPGSDRGSAHSTPRRVFAFRSSSKPLGEPALGRSSNPASACLLSRRVNALAAAAGRELATRLDPLRTPPLPPAQDFPTPVVSPRDNGTSPSAPSESPSTTSTATRTNPATASEEEVGGTPHSRTTSGTAPPASHLPTAPHPDVQRRDSPLPGPAALSRGAPQPDRGSPRPTTQSGSGSGGRRWRFTTPPPSTTSAFSIVFTPRRRASSPPPSPLVPSKRPPSTENVGRQSFVPKAVSGTGVMAADHTRTSQRQGLGLQARSSTHSAAPPAAVRASSPVSEFASVPIAHLYLRAPSCAVAQEDVGPHTSALDSSSPLQVLSQTPSDGEGNIAEVSALARSAYNQRVQHAKEKESQSPPPSLGHDRVAKNHSPTETVIYTSSDHGLASLMGSKSLDRPASASSPIASSSSATASPSFHRSLTLPPYQSRGTSGESGRPPSGLTEERDERRRQILMGYATYRRQDCSCCQGAIFCRHKRREIVRVGSDEWAAQRSGSTPSSDLPRSETGEAAMERPHHYDIHSSRCGTAAEPLSAGVQEQSGTGATTAVAPLDAMPSSSSLTTPFAPVDGVVPHHASVRTTGQAPIEDVMRGLLSKLQARATIDQEKGPAVGTRSRPLRRVPSSPMTPSITPAPVAVGTPSPRSSGARSPSSSRSSLPSAADAGSPPLPPATVTPHRHRDAPPSNHVPMLETNLDRAKLTDVPMTVPCPTFQPERFCDAPVRLRCAVDVLRDKLGTEEEREDDSPLPHSTVVSSSSTAEKPSDEPFTCFLRDVKVHHEDAKGTETPENRTLLGAEPQQEWTSSAAQGQMPAVEPAADHREMSGDVPTAPIDVLVVGSAPTASECGNTPACDGSSPRLLAVPREGDQTATSAAVSPPPPLVGPTPCAKSVLARIQSMVDLERRQIAAQEQRHVKMRAIMEVERGRAMTAEMLLDGRSTPMAAFCGGEAKTSEPLRRPTAEGTIASSQEPPQTDGPDGRRTRTTISIRTQRSTSTGKRRRHPVVRLYVDGREADRRGSRNTTANEDISVSTSPSTSVEEEEKEMTEKVPTIARITVHTGPTPHPPFSSLRSTSTTSSLVSIGRVPEGFIRPRTAHRRAARQGSRKHRDGPAELRPTSAGPTVLQGPSPGPLLPNTAPRPSSAMPAAAAQQRRGVPLLSPPSPPRMPEAMEPRPFEEGLDGRPTTAVSGVRRRNQRSYPHQSAKRSSTTAEARRIVAPEQSGNDEVVTPLRRQVLLQRYPTLRPDLYQCEQDGDEDAGYKTHRHRSRHSKKDRHRHHRRPVSYRHKHRHGRGTHCCGCRCGSRQTRKIETATATLSSSSTSSSSSSSIGSRSHTTTTSSSSRTDGSAGSHRTEGCRRQHHHQDGGADANSAARRPRHGRKHEHRDHQDSPTASEAVEMGRLSTTTAEPVPLQGGVSEATSLRRPRQPEPSEPASLPETKAMGLCGGDEGSSPDGSDTSAYQEVHMQRDEGSSPNHSAPPVSLLVPAEEAEPPRVTRSGSNSTTTTSTSISSVPGEEAPETSQSLSASSSVLAECHVPIEQRLDDAFHRDECIKQHRTLAEYHWTVIPSPAPSLSSCASSGYSLSVTGATPSHTLHHSSGEADRMALVSATEDGGYRAPVLLFGEEKSLGDAARQPLGPLYLRFPPPSASTTTSRDSDLACSPRHSTLLQQEVDTSGRSPPSGFVGPAQRTPREDTRTYISTSALHPPSARDAEPLHTNTLSCVPAPRTGPPCLQSTTDRRSSERLTLPENTSLLSVDGALLLQDPLVVADAGRTYLITVAPPAHRGTDSGTPEAAALSSFTPQPFFRSELPSSPEQGGVDLADCRHVDQRTLSPRHLLEFRPRGVRQSRCLTGGPAQEEAEDERAGPWRHERALPPSRSPLSRTPSVRHPCGTSCRTIRGLRGRSLVAQQLRERLEEQFGVVSPRPLSAGDLDIAVKGTLRPHSSQLPDGFHHEWMQHQERGMAALRHAPYRVTTSWRDGPRRPRARAPPPAATDVERETEFPLAGPDEAVPNAAEGRLEPPNPSLQPLSSVPRTATERRCLDQYIGGEPTSSAGRLTTLRGSPA